MSKTRKDAIRSNGSIPRNYTAYSMIVNGTGRSQVFSDRRNKRPDDFKNSWQREQEEDLAEQNDAEPSDKEDPLTDDIGEERIADDPLPDLKDEDD